MKQLPTPAALVLALSASLVYAPPAAAQGSIDLSVGFAPPVLPVYDQPPIPGPDYLWAPGYWAWDDDVQDYYWVPGTWVLAPRPGLLWTPPWWGWSDGFYRFHAGYWGPHVGFYGGVPYGFGYTGVGFQGAYWSGPHVSYNRSVTNVTHTINVTNVYNTTVVNRTTNVSYNGGPGGVQARPSAEQQAAMHEEHSAPTAAQEQHFQAARQERQLFAGANHGRPPVAAAARPGEFGDGSAVPTREAPTYRGPGPGEAEPQGARAGLMGGSPEVGPGAGLPATPPAGRGGADARSPTDRPALAPLPAARNDALPGTPGREYRPESAGRPPEGLMPRGAGSPDFNRPPGAYQAPIPRPPPMLRAQPMPRPQPLPRMAPPPRPRPMGGGGGGGHPGPRPPHR